MSKPNTRPLSIGLCRELFVDRLLADHPDKAHLKLHKPVTGGIAIQNDKPWEGRANGPMSEIDIGDRLLMYYRGCR